MPHFEKSESRSDRTCRCHGPVGLLLLYPALASSLLVDVPAGL